MEKMSALSNDDDQQMDLPPGFRFHPTDEELITHYLSPKVLDRNFCARAIGEVDLNKVEPWDLPWKAKMGEKEWYFFFIRDRKYPTGSRTNRATVAGYWKATGKDKEIFKGKTLVGMKKTLVFYKGRAPRGEKTNWVMHEYRLEGNNSMHNLPKSVKGEWVISRIFKKTSGGKKVHISGIGHGDNPQGSDLPPLMDVSSNEGHTKATLPETSSASCFSSQMEDHNVTKFSNSSTISANPSTPMSLASHQMIPIVENFHYLDSAWKPDHSILKLLIENDGRSLNQITKTEYSHDAGMGPDISSPVSNHGDGMKLYENQCFPMTPAGPVDIDCLYDF